MRRRSALVAAVLAGAFSTVGLMAGAANAEVLPEPVPPACIVVDQAPLHLQLGYAPNGPSDCTPLPPA